MISDADAFRAWYVEQGGSALAANSYLAYLRRVDLSCGGISEWQHDRPIVELADWVESQPHKAFGGIKNWRDSRSAIRKYAKFKRRHQTDAAHSTPSVAKHPVDSGDDVISLLREAKKLGARYYRATGKPLGVTGEVAELAASEKLGLDLCAAREPGFDAWDNRVNPPRRVQIKGRAVDTKDRYRGRCPAIKCGDLFDDVVLVLLDRTTLEPLEIWQSTEAKVVERLTKSGSKSRNERNSMGISQFRTIAQIVWSMS